MAISQSKYINIVSSASGQAAVGQRDLIGRVFTSNYLVPTGQVVEFDGGVLGALPSIGDYFGTTSAEYSFASKYFQANKNGTAPQKLSFARYASEATAAQLIGGRNAATLSQLQAETAGTLNVSVNGAAKEYTAINLSSADSLQAVATQLTSTVSGDGMAVTYDAANERFVLATTETGAGQTLTQATGTVAVLLGWDNGILSDGTDGATALETVSASAELSNNFFTFCFLDDLAIADITAIAEWTSVQNVRYMFSITATVDNASQIVTAVQNYDGVAVTLDKFNAYAGFMPMSRFAAVDYTQPNAAINMAYQQFTGVEPSVVTDTEANMYDAMRVNYYGATQQAGQQVSWYQDGVLQGSIADMGVYANEAWLKDNIAVNILNLRVVLNTLPANQTGVAMVLAQLTQSITLALSNGVILPGKTLDSTQKAFITQLTGNEDAWMNVQSTGYYVTADLVQYTDNGMQKYKVSYLLVYSKGDSINYVDGRDIMI